MDVEMNSANFNTFDRFQYCFLLTFEKRLWQ